MNKAWTGGQYSLFRVLFGGYLLQHFLSLLPWGVELFSNRGALSHASSSPLIHLFPNLLAICDEPGFVTALLLLCSLLSVLFAVGFWDRTAAFLLWYLCACLLGRNPLISNPGLPFICFQKHRTAAWQPASATTLLGIGACRNSPSSLHGH